MTDADAAFLPLLIVLCLAVILAGLAAVAVLLPTWRGCRYRRVGGTAATAADEVYADNNASTRMFPEALKAQVHASRLLFSNPSSIHAGGLRCREVQEDVRERVAKLLGASRNGHVVFTGGATESNNIAIRGVVRHRLAKKKHAPVRIVLTPVEHASVMQTVEAVAEGHEGVEFVTVDVDATGRIDMAHFTEIVQAGDVALACVIMGNNEIGTLQDVRGLARVCRANGTHLHCDMTQVVGKYRLDLRGLGVHTATFSAHKFHGPKGVGGLYVAPRARISYDAAATGGHQEGGRRGGTENLPGICAMASALEKCHVLLALQEDRRVRAMRDLVKSELRDRLPQGTLFNGHPRDGMYNTVSLCVPVNSREIIRLLNPRGIYINVGCACSNGDGSKTLRAIGRSDAQINGSVRISLSFMNTEAQCRRLCDALVQAVHQLMR